MTTRRVVATVLLLFLGCMTCSLGIVRAEETRVHFGLEHAGSPFPPPSGHDASGHSRDSIVPFTVVIQRGGSVTYEIEPFHQPAVYRPGVVPTDIQLNPTTLKGLSLPCLPQPLEQFVIDDPTGRVALGPGQACEEQIWTTPAGTFDQPGRYLVICTTVPHFNLGMWGWVIVK